MGAAVFAVVACRGDDHRVLHGGGIPDGGADGALIQRVGGRNTRCHTDIDHLGAHVRGMHDGAGQCRDGAGLLAPFHVAGTGIHRFEGPRGLPDGDDDRVRRDADDSVGCARRRWRHLGVVGLAGAGSPGPLDGASGGGGGGGGAGTVWVIVTGEGGGGGAGGGGARREVVRPASVGGGPAGGGNAGALGIGAGIGVPCGAAPITDATMVPCASQSVRPSPPMM